MKPFRHSSVPGGMALYRDICGIAIPFPALERGYLHGRTHVGPWNARALMDVIGKSLWLSFYESDEEETDEAKRAPKVLCGLLPAGGVVELELCENAVLDDLPRYELRVFAPSEALAVTLLDHLRAEFLLDAKTGAAGPRIALLNASYSNLDVQRVRVTAEQLIARSQIDLFYGEGASAWVDSWITRLSERRYGLSILSGEPGTGKTSLLRSLAAWTSDSHLFYFMPAARFGHIDAGELVTFWVNENRLSKQRKVLVLEDAESVLLRRDGDNREKVATLLNLTDGLMGDALGVHVVCTLNSAINDLDPALLRPGRLVAHREFRRLTRIEAERLATHLGKPKPSGESISLAALFNPQLPVEQKPQRARVMGFHTQIKT
jgi:hypothetical protein